MPPTELTAEQVRQVCDATQFTFRSTEEVPDLAGVIGQERAMRAVTFGIGIHDNGYHMYALGPIGTGKTTTILKHLEQQATTQPVPDDWLYFNNFADPDKPHALRLPPGVGSKFKADMDRLVDELRQEIPRAFEGEEYTKQQEQLSEEVQKRQQQLIGETNEFAQSKGLAILQTPQGLMIAPAHNGSVMRPEQIEHLDQAAREQLEAAQGEVQAHIRDTMRVMQQLRREQRDKSNDLDRRTIAYAIDHLIDEIRDRYQQYAAVVKLTEEIRHDIMENVDTLKQVTELEQMRAEQGPMALMMGRPQLTFDQYRVNLIVDNGAANGAPVILARNPTYHNLLGRVEHQGQFGTLVTNFQMIKSGLLHKANGGYLMLDVRDVLTKPLSYEGLKRALKNKLVEMESLAESYGLFATRSLEPEPIPLDVKVVLIGDAQIYYLLYAYDPEFQELFKVKVDFAVHMPRTPETTAQYARFIATVVREEGLRHFEPSGVAKVVEHGARLVEHAEKLATKFGDVVDLIRQASFWAVHHGHALVNAEDVKMALEEKVYRANQIQQRLQEAVAEGILLIDTGGAVAGQINGLSVLSLGDYAFGQPSRITARIQVGTQGVVSIDREVKMGGPIHNKGALILAGYLGGKYAIDTPLALSATLTFEQSYSEIEGDSASSTELYALLSALSGFPIRQDLAVTGSVNQLGQVQAIGGVNQKVEGYFDICRLHGLTGSQGVMIPASNAKHLMLRDDVVEAVRAGQFHIYPIPTIDDGIALLTGKPAGDVQPDGAYPPDTVNAAVQRRLKELAEKVKAFVKPEDAKKDEDSSH